MDNEKVNYGDTLEGIFKENGWQFGVRHLDENSVFTLPMAAKNCPGFNVSFIVNNIGVENLGNML